MDNRSALNAITAWRLLDAGRIDEALGLAGDLPGLAALIAHLGRSSPPPDAPGNSVTAPAVTGWKQYYRAEYADAVTTWSELYPSGLSWVDAWVALGFAKVATDVGRFATALGWAGVSAAHARAGEHLDLLAAVCGARGEVLLRGGRPLAAAESFAEDIALLPPGCRFLGRIRCYRAHAWARLGEDGEVAAEIAYRQAAHSPHERTDPYAWAGLALLAAARADKDAICSLLDNQPQDGMPGAWMLVAAVRAGVRPPDPSLKTAAERFGGLHRWERRWLHGWARSLGLELAAPPELCRHDTPQLPDWRSEGELKPSAFDLPVSPHQLDDRGFADGSWPSRHPDLWHSRHCFMP